MPQYGSKFRAFRVNIRPKVEKMHPSMPVVVETIDEMVAEFGVHRPEVEVETDAGVERYGDISGFFYDLDADAAAKNWSDEEYKIALARLDSLCDTWPEAIWRLEALAPVAPWASYDAMGAKDIVPFAELGGFDLAAVAAYERANANRKEVLEAVEKAVGQAELEEELTAA